MTGVAFWALIAVVVLAPLPYGAVHLWAYSLMAVLVGGLTVLWAVAAAFRPEACAVGWRRYAVPAGSFAAALIWIGLQACAAVPAAWQHPLWQDARAALGDAAVPAISLDPDATLLVLMRLATYGAVFWMAMQLGRDHRRAMQMLWAIAAAGVAYAVYGLGIEASGSNTILLAEKWAYQGVLTGTLVNRNHYAAYAGIGLIVSFGLLIHEARREGRGAFDSPALMIYSIERLGLGAFVIAVACVALAMALLLTQSRGGMLFTAAALVALVLLLGAGGTIGRRSGLAIVLSLIAGGILLVAVSGEGLLSRLIAPSSSVGRAEIHALTMDAIAAAPWTGHGAGTFARLFQLFRPEDFPAISPTYSAAHSVYLETVAEIGIVGALPFFGALGWIVAACLVGSRHRRRGAVVPAVAGAAAVLAGLHSAVDFGMQIPGVAVTLAALLGVGYAQSWSSQDS